MILSRFLHRLAGREQRSYIEVFAYREFIDEWNEEKTLVYSAESSHFACAWNPSPVIFSTIACSLVLSPLNSTWASFPSKDTYEEKLRVDLSQSSIERHTFTDFTPSILPTLRSIFLTHDWHVIPSTWNTLLAFELISWTKNQIWKEKE